MWSSSELLRCAGARAALLTFAAAALFPQSTCAAVAGPDALPAPTGTQAPASAWLEGTPPPASAESAARAARANSVLRCFQGGHLVYEGYDLHLNQRAAQVIDLRAAPAGSVQLLDLQDGLCVLENRLP